MALIQRLHPSAIEIQKTSKIKWKLVKTKIQFGHTEDYIEVDDVVLDYIKVYNLYYGGLTLTEFLDKI